MWWRSANRRFPDGQRLRSCSVGLPLSGRVSTYRLNGRRLSRDCPGPAAVRKKDVLEFLGGIALILGLATRYVAALFVIEMAFTTMLVKVDVGLIAPEGGPGAELDILILAIALSLVLTGAGRWSVDAFVAGRRRVTDSAVQRHVE
ncbi:MAG TPA: DoxX family protein [Acidimicrobiia bacterium]|nr:DoxX family protein [Acidimicrobiia bacterium]